ncbi:mast cell protease 1A-like isoform X2 [Trematomus bernacchii]|uniref:mast cell protease 1A-like isoform X1 n=1 Tax=Trematomus bernacchii TaxID=40690 RepID=UPI00146B72E2|nr:mast cell protease 1A-like isoform X1 [Trematomus bernacchii]XP_034003733.1 mast cell protease 1A-like isoform X2 [Trematomus bernacchii]
MHALHKLLLFQVLTSLGQNALGSEIINGEKVPENKMLFMASVQNSRNKHICGGFLINEDFVVTAAHCDDGNPTSVVLGTHNLKNIDDTMRYSVKKCKHRCYEKVEEGSDIMLLKLSKKAQLNQRLQPISLPETETKITNIETCTVAGWGLTSVGEPDELQMVNVPIVDLDVCKSKWPNMLPENVICAGGYGTDKGFCQGDSGGPLVCNGKAAGVVSYNWSKNCRYPNRPNVYTDVSKYLPWIRKMMTDC